jgi:hypothetical protein
MHIMVGVTFSVKGFKGEEQFGINVPKMANAEIINRLAKERCKGIVAQKQGIDVKSVVPSVVELLN